MHTHGLYEQLINKLIASKLDSIDRTKYYIKETLIDKNEASRILSQHLCEVIKLALGLISDGESIEKQIEISNKIILLLRDELKDQEFEDDLISAEGKILSAIFPKLDAKFSDFDKYLKEITPYTRLAHSELFTGSNAGISLESEIKKEILSSNEIFFLVSFIKWTGIRIFERELREFTADGGKLKIITTSYMGATDLKAIEFLSGLPNTEIKVSYNISNERLHAKAYLFKRHTGFDTGYIGSSNLSRSALTSGLEWNLKITTKEVSHIIDKFYKTFETYWQDQEFEIFNKVKDSEKLRIALKKAKIPEYNTSVYFDIKPYRFQEEILEKLVTERTIHKRYKNLIVAATGTGKTVISAFDFYNFYKLNPKAKLLFIAHRKEILEQAQATFQGVLKDNNFGELWVDGIEPERYDQVFASVQTLTNRIENSNLSQSFYDFIIIDEVHHISASSYRPILNHFIPQILLGLTATPERMDGEDILKDFCNTISAEIRLPEALNLKLLCPFQYFGVSDNVDLSNVNWKNGKYDPVELTKIYTKNDRRVLDVISALDKYLNDKFDVRALCFCVTVEHAQSMAEKFTLAGFKSDYLIGSSDKEHRKQIRRRLLNKDINYLFVVDIFNEGIDIPEIDTVLFLRPTESLTIFLQQLGRGLRLADGKECLTVLDFVGNSRPEYDFESKFRALIGKTNTSILKEIEDDLPHLPLGCAIVLEKKAKDVIISNVKSAISFNRKKLIQKIINYKHQTTLPLSLKNFTKFYHIDLQLIYKNTTNWRRLCVEASQIDDFSSLSESQITRAISKKWLACNSYSYLNFILTLAKNNFNLDPNSLLNETTEIMCLMLYYDVWQDAGQFPSLEKGIKAIGNDQAMVDEIIEILEILIDKIDFLEKEIELPYKQSLKVHSRYTRDQILASFKYYSFEKKPSSREGVVFLKDKNTELLFITLNKSDKDYSPTTLYEDYAISETQFHWQTQNVVSPQTSKGLSYINHRHEGKIILLFVREKNEDEFGNTMSYIFIGKGNILEHSGSKPMNIRWELNEPMPHYIWKDSAKMAVG